MWLRIGGWSPPLFLHRKKPNSKPRSLFAQGKRGTEPHSMAFVSALVSPPRGRRRRRSGRLHGARASCSHALDGRAGRPRLAGVGRFESLQGRAGVGPSERRRRRRTAAWACRQCRANLMWSDAGEEEAHALALARR